MIGRVVGNYRVVRELGSGAMGAVYEGVDVMVERPVAIKMLRAEIARQPDLIERFRVEAVTLAKLNHPSIATLYSFFRDGDDYYMVMEFVRGHTLEEVIKQSGHLAPKAAADILRQTLDGLGHAHQMGILHRDVKPANIMITGDGRVKVTDFGIARVLGSARMTREGRIIGTLEYIAPERIKGEETDARSDLYSAGVVMYEALAGRLPFTSDTDFGLMQAHLKEPPPPLVVLGVNCPPALEGVVARALAKSPQDRFGSAKEFRDALMAAVPRGGTRAATISAAGPEMKPTRLADGDVAMAPTRLAGTPAVPGPLPPSQAKALPLKAIVAVAAGLAVVALGGISTLLYLRFRAPVQTAAVATPPPAAQAPPSAAQPGPAIQPTPGLEQPAQVAMPVPQGQLPLAPAEPAPSQPAPATRQPAVVTRPSAGIPASPGATAPGGAGRTNPAANGGRSSEPVPPEPVARVSSAEPPPPPVPSIPTPAVQRRPVVRSIRDVHTVYIERMSPDLKEYVAEEISRQMVGRLTVVSRKEEADAIMSGKEESSEGLGSKVTGGYLGMKDKANATVSITDVSRSTLLWSSQAGDKTPLIGVMRRGGLKKVAERLVSSLRKSMEY